MKYPLIALPLSTLLILTGCGGSGSGGDDKVTPPPTPTPTVTVTAPTSAIANVAFDVQWTSTDAANCAAKFTKATTTSGTASVTETTTGSKTYEVSCTSADGTQTGKGSATVQVDGQATAEGLWQGTGKGNGGDRAVSGVVTKEDAYWLTYSAANATNVVGFFAGVGSSQPDATGTAGSFASGNLREFNFEGVEAGGGSLSAGSYNKTGSDKAVFAFGGTTNSTALSASYIFNGTQLYSIDNVTDGICAPTCAAVVPTPNPPTFDDGGTPWTIVPSANNMNGTPSLTGTFRFQAYSIFTDLNPIGVSATLNLDYPSRTLTISGGTATWNPSTFVLKLTGVTFTEASPGFDCDDGGDGSVCAIVPGPTVATTGDVTITYTDSQLNEYNGVAHTYQLANAAVGDGCIGQGGGDWCANGELTFHGTIPNVLPVSQTLATTYNAAYETTPALADVAGAFSGSDGVGTTLNSSSSLSVSAAGAVTATAENGQCAVTGSLATHPTGGNVYDATLTFANGTGTCTYSGAFTGVATYDAETSAITVTAINAARNQGFLFTGSKAQPQ